MDDKIYDLMGKMYTEMNSKFKDMNSKFKDMNSKFEEMNSKFDSKFDEINKKLDTKADKNDIVRLEDKLENNSKALFDGYSQTYEKLTVIEKKVEDISIKVEKQDIEIRIIKNIAN